MKIKDWMKLGAGVALAYCTYSVTTGVIEGLVTAVFDETIKKSKDSKPENEEES